jgi:hypothetical protein
VPTLIITSRQDHVVNPDDSDILAAEISGPVERLWLEKSFHVASEPPRTPIRCELLYRLYVFVPAIHGGLT